MGLSEHLPIYESERLAIRNRILSVFEEHDVVEEAERKALSVALSHFLAPTVERIVAERTRAVEARLADAWDEGYEAFAQQFVSPMRADGTRETARNPYRAALADEAEGGDPAGTPPRSEQDNKHP